MHAGLLVGTWAATVGHDPACVRCISQEPESPRHCFWACTSSHLVWRAVSLLLYRVGIQQGYVTWGAVSWLQHLPGPHLFFEGEEDDRVFMLFIGDYSCGSPDMLSIVARP